MVRFLAIIWALLPLPALAEQALVAVASNFLKPAEVLAAAFEAESGHQIDLASGSTGQHFAQIVHGAPYDAFLAADQERPARLIEKGLASDAITYAVGRLAFVHPLGTELGAEPLRFLAIANPDLAPYGLAARQVLASLGLPAGLIGGEVQGQNVGQAYGMVASGNASGGLVAWSLAMDGDVPFTLISAELHEPIRQDAVLLSRGARNVAAQEFLSYLASDTAQEMIVTFGYDRADAVK